MPEVKVLLGSRLPRRVRIPLDPGFTPRASRTRAAASQWARMPPPARQHRAATAGRNARINTPPRRDDDAVDAIYAYSTVLTLPGLGEPFNDVATGPVAVGGAAGPLSSPHPPGSVIAARTARRQALQELTCSFLASRARCSSIRRAVRLGARAPAGSSGRPCIPRFDHTIFDNGRQAFGPSKEPQALGPGVVQDHAQALVNAPLGP